MHDLPKTPHRFSIVSEQYHSHLKFSSMQQFLPETISRLMHQRCRSRLRLCTASMLLAQGRPWGCPTVWCILGPQRVGSSLSSFSDASSPISSPARESPSDRAICPILGILSVAPPGTTSLTLTAASFLAVSTGRRVTFRHSGRGHTRWCIVKLLVCWTTTRNSNPWQFRGPSVHEHSLRRREKANLGRRIADWDKCVISKIKCTNILLFYRYTEIDFS